MFELVSHYLPAGDQPQAIKKLTPVILSGAKHQTLLGFTGSGNWQSSRLREVARAESGLHENMFCVML